MKRYAGPRTYTHRNAFDGSVSGEEFLDMLNDY